MSMLSRVRKSSIVRFLAAFVSASGVSAAPMLVENPTEEIDHAISRGDNLTLHYASQAQARGRAALSDLQAKRGEVVGEENYLHSTRRYPASPDNNLPAGNHIPQGSYAYFQYSVNSANVGAGFPTGFTPSYNETNLTVAQQIPTGQGFRIWQEAVTFNMQANPEDIEQVLDSGDFQFQTQSGQYTLYKGPFAGWPGGWGVSGFSDTQGQASAHNGIADPRAVKRLQFPRTLKAQQQFSYLHNVGVNGLANRPDIPGLGGTPNVAKLSDFVNVRVVLWGDQLTKMAS